MTVDLTAEPFVQDVQRLGKGMRMADLFALAKTYDAMEPAEIRKLLHDTVDEVRLGAVSIMDFQGGPRRPRLVGGSSCMSCT